jgi:hypothetical protein
LLFALLLFAPIVFTLHLRRPALDAFDSWFVGGLFVSLAMTTIVASKPGAGRHHFFAACPYFYMCFVLCSSGPGVKACTGAQPSRWPAPGEAMSGGVH